MPLSNKQFYVYLTASKRNGTLYLGMTSDLIGRIYQHKNKITKGFTSKYDVSLLVWYEVHESAMAAIEREKQLKNWKRRWKLELIEMMNADWHDLYDELI